MKTTQVIAGTLAGSIMDEASKSLVRRDAARDGNTASVTHPWPVTFVLAAVLSIAFTALWIGELVAPAGGLRLFF
jgi:hypothetical protein